MMPKYLNPKNDIAFKKIFGTEKNKDILLHFLNDIIAEQEGGKIKEITLLNPVQQPEIAMMKQSIVDVLCKDQSGAHYIVEMQVSKVQGFEKRAQYYAAKTYTNQLDRGNGEYVSLKKVLFLAIAEYVLFPDDPRYKSTYTTRNEITNKCDLKDLKFIFIELPKFNKNKIEDLQTYEEKWCYFLKNAHNADDETTAEFVRNSGEVIQKAYHELEVHNWTRSELDTYEDREKSAKDAKAIFNAAVDDLVAQGRKEAEKRGRRKGKEEGAKNKTIEIAKNLLVQGLDKELIAKATGLSLEEISSLAKRK